MFPLVGCGTRQAVEKAHPQEIARAFREAEDRRTRRDRGEPRPARCKGERAGKQPLRRVPRGLAEAPEHERGKAARRERVAPEGDQRGQGRTTVKAADMRMGVAKFYKEVVNAGEMTGWHSFKFAWKN